MWQKLKTNNKLLIIVLLILLITLIIGSIYYLQQSTSSPSAQSVTVNLKGYNEFRQKIEFLNDPNAASGSAVIYGRVITALKVLEDNKSSQKDKYDALVEAVAFVQSLYGYSNDPKLYPLISDFSVFAKENFPNLYKEHDFYYPCQDPSCATTPTPKEISDIIDEINNSNIDQEIKDTYVKNLMNATYLPTKTNPQLLDAVTSYYISATFIKEDGAFTKAGLNEKFYNEIIVYLNKTYPDEFKQILK